MALYYGKTLIVPDTDVSNENNTFIGTNTFINITPSNGEPLGVAEIPNGQFFVSYENQLRAVSFDDLAAALSSKLEDAGFARDTGGVELGEPIGLNMSMGGACYILSSYGYPPTEQVSATTEMNVTTKNLKYYFSDAKSKVLRADYWFQRKYRAEWTVQCDSKGLIININSQKASTIMPAVKKANNSYYNISMYRLLKDRAFTKSARSIYDKSSIKSNSYRAFAHTGSKTTKAKILYGLHPYIYWKDTSNPSSPVVRELSNYLAFTGQTSQDYVHVKNGDTFIFVCWGCGFSSMPCKYYDNVSGTYGKQLTAGQLQTGVNHMIKFNYAPQNVSSISAVAVSGGIAGQTFKLSVWKSK